MPAADLDELRLLTAKEVTALLRVRRSTVYEAVRSGALRAVPLGGSHLRFRRQDVADYLDRLAGERPPAPLVTGSGRRRNTHA